MKRGETKFQEVWTTLGTECTQKYRCTDFSVSILFGTVRFGIGMYSVQRYFHPYF
jgi:hypothetical protein